MTGDNVFATKKNLTDEDFYDSGLDLRKLTKGIDLVCILYFILEYAIRLWSCPNKTAFLLSPMNFADLLAILPFFISVIMNELQALKVFWFHLKKSISVLDVFPFFPRGYWESEQARSSCPDVEGFANLQTRAISGKSTVAHSHPTPSQQGTRPFIHMFGDMPSLLLVPDLLRREGDQQLELRGQFLVLPYDHNHGGVSLLIVSGARKKHVSAASFLVSN